MTSRSQLEKLVADVNDCVVELLKDFSNCQVPINDDNVTLHHFAEKLELVLQYGIKERLSLIGSKKTFFDYIRASFSSLKRSHDGLKHVKSMHELYTSLGHGRALLRFCLMHKCLADTLQTCFTNRKTTIEYYNEKSVPLQQIHSSALVVSLYELNELNFDLISRHADLDICWPTFARKLFISSEDLNSSSRNNSISSLSSQFSADLKMRIDESLPGDFTGIDEPLIHSRLCQCDNKERRRSCQCDNEEHKSSCQCDNKERRRSCQCDNEELRRSCQYDNEEHRRSCQCDNKEPRRSCQCDNKEHKTYNSACCNIPKSEELQTISSQNFELHSNYRQATELQIKSLELENQELLRKVSALEYKLKIKHDSYLPEMKDNFENPNSVGCNENINEAKVITEIYAECVKDFVMKQYKVFGILEKKLEISIEENNNLYSKICVLRDLLHSYGLLKASTKTNSAHSISLNLTSTNYDSKDGSEFCDNESLKSIECYHIETLKPLLNFNADPAIDILRNALLKFRSLCFNVDKLQSGIKSSQTLNDNLLSRVKDQEIRLKGVTKELEEAQILVSVMKEQHQKLQSSEEIFKYDLQEKRKLMNKLKKQLESTREDWNRVRQKNSKSEAEWKDLRKEFVLRQKQASEESGFIDDKGFEDQIPCKKHFDEIDGVKPNNITVISEPCSAIRTTEVVESPQPKTRLELLEEQCQLLHSNLLRNKSKRQELDTRLETICKGIDVSSNKKETLNINISTEHSEIDSGECCSPTSLEECVREDLSEESLVEFNEWNEVQTSSEIGSLNSDYSSSPHALCTETISLDDCSSEIPDTDRCLPCPISSCGSKGEQSNEIINTFLNADKDSPSTLNFPHGSDCLLLLNYDNFQRDLVSTQSSQFTQSSYVEEYKNEDVDSIHHIPLTQVDSLLIKKKDLEKCLEHLQLHNCNYMNDNIKNFKQEKIAFKEEIFILKNEKELLQKEVEDLRNNLMCCEIQLNELSKQLTLTKATKEEEVAALHYQLNTEALKHERALKQFQENDQALNDMKQKISDQEQLICALEDALTEMKMEKEYEDKHRWQELEEIQLALMAREEECLVLSQDFEKLKDMKARNQEDRAFLEAELERLRSDSRDLKKKLVKLLKEKDILWQKTDHLSHLQKVKIADRWLADHEVSNCLGCHSQFSFILRKHHCRLCGRIFCYSCSNNWLLTTASRKKSRVCNECYKQHLEIKQEARRGSEVLCLLEDSDDETINNLLAHPMSIGSLFSDNSESIRNSRISLPGNDVHLNHSSLFASAPNLNYINQDERSNLHDEGKAKSLPKISCLSDEVFPCSDMKISPGISLTMQYSIIEIKSKNGITGEVIVNAGMICRFPILNENPPNDLYWSFIWNSEIVPVSLLYESHNKCQQFQICNRDHKMEDNAELLSPGVYAVQIINSSSAVQKLKYTFKIKDSSTMN